MGIRLTPTAAQTQVWSRVLLNGDVAVALYNKGSASGGPPPPPIPPPSKCAAADWTVTKKGFYQVHKDPPLCVDS